MSAQIDFVVPRMAVWAKTIPLVDRSTGQPMLFDGFGADFEVWSSWLDEAPVISVTSSGGSPFVDVANRSIEVMLTLAQVEQLRVLDLAVYRLRLIDPDGVPAVLLHGRLHLSPELHRG